MEAHEQLKTRSFGIRYFLPVIGLLSLLTACGVPDRTSQENPSPTATPPTQTQKSPVEVKLSEFKIEMPASIPAGTTTFKVTNTGKVVHNFEIEGNGIEQELETNLKPGETQTLQVDLTPGKYQVYCPVGNHEQKGMILGLTVKE